ncbi:MAG: hypothetical protein ABR879_00965 [Methanomassiliicoccales archaeon]|jgi:uncharacterized membrane protein HdeD (DUF308 family)
MPSIEDFVQNLYKGEKEVSVPKDKVTKLSPGWHTSKLNLPHKGSKGSWRNGLLHAHDMGDHYLVHLDRVDPGKHSISHMIADAPLMLFLWTGFRDVSKGAKGKKAEGQEVPTSKWMPHVVIGSALLLIGIVIVADNALALNVIYLAAAAALLVLGIAFIWRGLGITRKPVAWIGVVIGVIAIIIAAVIYFVPVIAFWILLLTLAVWTLGSGLFLILGRGDKLQFDAGSLAPFIMGIASLALAIALVFNPSSGLNVVVTLGGLLVAFMGLMQVVAGVILRNALASVADEKS